MALLLIAALVVPGQALAGSNCNKASSNPSAAQYCEIKGVNGEGGNGPAKNQGGNSPASDESAPIEAEVAPVAASSAVEPSGDTLPFTGLDVGIVALVAAGLVAMGFVLRRLSTAEQSGR